jgi:type I restriction enzyme S subunit
MMTVPKLRFKNLSGNEFPIWNKRKLLELSEGGFSNGVFNDPKKIGSGYRLINVLDMYIPSTIDESKLSRVAISEAEFKNNKVEHGDIFFTRSSLVKEGIAFSNVYLGNSDDITYDGHLIRLRPKKDLINSTCFNYLLRSKSVRNQLVMRGKTATMTTIGQADIATVEVEIPSVDEQIRIASFLSAVDQKISLLTKKHQLLIQYKQGVMQKIFNQEIRFKDKDGKNFPNWTAKKVGEIFKVTRGNVLAMTKVSPEKNTKDLYPVYSSQTKNNGLAGYFSAYLYENAVTWTTDGANAGDVKYRDGKFYCTNVCGVLLSDKGQANSCMAYLINLVSRQHVSYVGNPKLMNNVMAAIPLLVPSVGEQIMISALINSFDAKIEAIKFQIKLIQDYKQGLLQQMFI